jgi:hypothetical protein
MVVVRLSSTALRKNVTKPTSHNSVVILVVILSVMTLKPSCASTTSTIVVLP